MSILFLSPSGQIGGAESALHEMIAGLRDAHPSWSLGVVAGADGPLVDKVKALGARVEVLPFPPALARLSDWKIDGVGQLLALILRCAVAVWPTLVYLRRLRRLIQAQAPDVVHTNGLKMHVLGAYAAPKTTPVVWHFHDFAAGRRLTSRLLRRSVRRCAAIVANSRSVAQDARSVCGGDIVVYPVWNAVDLVRFAPAGPRADLDALAHMAPASPEVVRVGLVATFARWKGHETFLEAMALVPASTPVRGYIIGGPVYQTTGSQVALRELRERAEALGLGARVGFTGFVTDSAAAIRSLDVVVHASTDPEPFGLVIAEAMACGKAVVASRGGGAIELTEACAGSVTHVPGDARDLANRIQELAGDPALRARLGAAGRETAERCFTRSRLALELTPIYQGLAHVH